MKYPLFLEPKDLSLVDVEVEYWYKTLMNSILAQNILELPDCPTKDRLYINAKMYLEALDNEYIKYFEDLRSIDDFIEKYNDNRKRFTLYIQKLYEILSVNNILFYVKVDRNDLFERLIQMLSIKGIDTSILKLNKSIIITKDRSTNSLQNIYRIIKVIHNGLVSKGVILK